MTPLEFFGYFGKEEDEMEKRKCNTLTFMKIRQNLDSFWLGVFCGICLIIGAGWIAGLKVVSQEPLSETDAVIGEWKMGSGNEEGITIGPGESFTFEFGIPRVVPDDGDSPPPKDQWGFPGGLRGRELPIEPLIEELNKFDSEVT